MVVRNNPDGDIYDLLGRQDLERLLAQNLAAAEAIAQELFLRAWPPGDSSAYRDQLAADISRAYAESEVALRQAAVLAFQEVPAEVFTLGVHRPGSNPAMEAARRRAEMVRHVAVNTASYLGMRNYLTVEVARVRHAGESVLAEEAGAEWLKKWVCRKDADGQPDHRVCAWCRALDAMAAIPVIQEFPYGDNIGGHRSPRVYRDLLCPPRHPRCRCRIILVRAGTVEAGAVPAPAVPDLFVSAATIRGLSETRYRALYDFLRAAIHELGQVLRRILQEVGIA